MQGTRTHSSYHQQSHSFIKPQPVPSNKHVTQVNHTRILSRFFLPSLGGSKKGSAGRMQFKVTKASAGGLKAAGANNNLKTIPHSLYDDPAFSADPNSNPLCSASHDISSWVIDPPKGHPNIRSPQVHRFSQNSHGPIPPPNSPVSVLHVQQQAHVTMIKPIASSFVSPPSTSPPDLSSTASSASDSSLQTPGASQTDIPSASGNKKRLTFSFFKRKSADGAMTNRLVKPSKKASASANARAVHILPPSNNSPVGNGSADAMNGVTNEKRAGPVREQPTRALDMIDEMDESNPLGIALHHGGPYEAIQRVVGANKYALPRGPLKHDQQQYSTHDQPFRFDVPLGLSPGQVLPHSVTPYYRPRVPSESVGDVHRRLDFHSSITGNFTDGGAGAGAIMNQLSMDQSVTSLASNQASHSSTRAPPAYATSVHSPSFGSTDEVQLVNHRSEPPEVQLISATASRSSTPVDGIGQLLLDSDQISDTDSDSDVTHQSMKEAAAEETGSRVQDTGGDSHNLYGVDMNPGPLPNPYSVTGKSRNSGLANVENRAEPLISLRGSSQTTPPPHGNLLSPEPHSVNPEPRAQVTLLGPPRNTSPFYGQPSLPYQADAGSHLQSRASLSRNTSPTSHAHLLSPELHSVNPDPYAQSRVPLLGPTRDAPPFYGQPSLPYRADTGGHLQSRVSLQRSPRSTPPTSHGHLPPPIPSNSEVDAQYQVPLHGPPNNALPPFHGQLPPSVPYSADTGSHLQSRVSLTHPTRNTPPPPHFLHPSSVPYSGNVGSHTYSQLSLNGSAPPSLHGQDPSSVPYLTDAARHGSRTYLHGTQGRTPPPPHGQVLPSVPYDQHRPQEALSMHDRRVREIQASSSGRGSSLRSGASSIMTGMAAPSTSGTSEGVRSRVLPKQLVMPAPLAQAAGSSRLPPTHPPQSVSYLQGVPTQHRVRFSDGMVYNLPVTSAMAPAQTLAVDSSKSNMRAHSTTRGGKLKKQNSSRGPEPPEIVARLAAAPQVVQSRRYMEPPPTIPEAPRIDKSVQKGSVKKGKRTSMF